MTTIERYVPQGSASLSSDAPGWEGETGGDDGGPTCWKCRGSGQCKAKREREKSGQKHKRRKEQQPQNADGEELSTPVPPPLRQCPVCGGSGRIPPKAKASREGARDLPPMITRARRCPVGWTARGPDAAAMRRLDTFYQQVLLDRHALTAYSTGEAIGLGLLHRACRRPAQEDGRGTTFDVLLGSFIKEDPPKVQECREGLHVPLHHADVSAEASAYYYPSWVPRNPGEQLCNLVGNWRILQRQHSHRWTTDDIVTAHVASRVALGLPLPGQKESEVPPINESQSDGTFNHKRNRISILDLGTGNASVLQMTCWALWENYDELEAWGVEARSEAVGLACRSLLFNVGEEGGRDSSAKSVRVIRSDFRDLIGASDADDNYDKSTNTSSTNVSQGVKSIRSKKFDLVTGTPPYFQVDFTTEANGAQVQSATIVQGGMPTSVQSAPARCEFRGGVEAYCRAAASVLDADRGKFVVCENWLNNGRVYDGARAAGLEVIVALPVKGKEGRGENLFGVYIMRKAIVGKEGPSPQHVLEPLAVRSEKGEWTAEYCKVMNDMSIPTASST